MKALFNDQKLYKTNDLEEIICTLFLNDRINRKPCRTRCCRIRTGPTR